MDVMWYRQTSSINHTKYLNLKFSHLVLQLSLSVVGAVQTGDAPTTSEWSAVILLSKVRLILEVWMYLGPEITSYLSVIYETRYLSRATVYPKKYAHGSCFAVLCCGYTLTDFPTSIRLTSLALWQSNDCPSASKATLMNMDKYVMWIHYERLHNHNKAKHNKTVCIFLGIYCSFLHKYLDILNNKSIEL